MRCRWPLAVDDFNLVGAHRAKALVFANGLSQSRLNDVGQGVLSGGDRRGLFSRAGGSCCS